MGDRSARLAAALMKLPDSALKKLELDEDLREVIERARAVESHIARRRAERTLAGELRRFELTEIDEQLAKIEQVTTGSVDVQQFHLAEKWRARLIEEGVPALAEFPGGADDELPRLIGAAQRERSIGQPKGASRILFRHVAERLKAAKSPDPRPDPEDDPTSDD